MPECFMSLRYRDLKVLNSKHKELEKEKFTLAQLFESLEMWI